MPVTPGRARRTEQTRAVRFGRGLRAPLLASAVLSSPARVTVPCDWASSSSWMFRKHLGRPQPTTGKKWRSDRQGGHEVIH
jgi:hypothetical protein